MLHLNEQPKGFFIAHQGKSQEKRTHGLPQTMAACNPRLKSEYIKLLNSQTDVKIKPEEGNALEIIIPGPKDTPYEGGNFRIFIKLPPEYPYKSPSVGFETRIYHPNVDEKSGSVCLDVLNQYWSPLFDCTNIVDSFIPLLLNYPNALDPLNPEAAAMMIKNAEEYEVAVRRHVAEFSIRESDKNKAPSNCSSSIDSDSLDF